MRYVLRRHRIFLTKIVLRHPVGDVGGTVVCSNDGHVLGECSLVELVRVLKQLLTLVSRWLKHSLIEADVAKGVQESASPDAR